MADNRSTPVTKEAKPFCTQIGDVQPTLSGPIIPIPNATLTIQRGKVHHHVYPTNLDTFMRDHVFVKIMETEEETDPRKINWNTCTYCDRTTVTIESLAK
ncbi:hypothetical protein DSO57_1025355 [Entomophthora muscae]|uniref:Uncharacterized protein n=1 Tax=Entomophthora muscae TaxID=34485 RepID=A0ACC2SRM7_9FUNG|nr:hypothetical protein DSO57_1025355 [Entomophthora muscae]